MMKVAMSSAGAGLLRALLKRVGMTREDVRLESYLGTDWHSLTFAGERHEFALRLPGAERISTAAALIGGLSDDEFVVPGQIVAEICGEATATLDGLAIMVRIEALTIEE